MILAVAETLFRALIMPLKLFTGFLGSANSSTWKFFFKIDGFPSFSKICRFWFWEQYWRVIQFSASVSLLCRLIQTQVTLTGQVPQVTSKGVSCCCCCCCSKRVGARQEEQVQSIPPSFVPRPLCRRDCFRTQFKSFNLKRVKWPLVTLL